MCLRNAYLRLVLFLIVSMGSLIETEKKIYENKTSQTWQCGLQQVNVKVSCFINVQHMYVTSRGEVVTASVKLTSIN